MVLVGAPSRCHYTLAKLSDTQLLASPYLTFLAFALFVAIVSYTTIVAAPG